MRAPARVDSDEDLAQRAAQGDDAAFGELVARWVGRVFRLVHRFFRKREDAEDVTQEIFLKMYRSLDGYRRDAPFEHWLLRIASNACQDELRRRRRHPSKTLTEVSADAATWLDRALAGEALTAAQVEAARTVASDLLDRLPPKDRMGWCSCGSTSRACRRRRPRAASEARALRSRSAHSARVALCGASHRARGEREGAEPRRLARPVDPAPG
jgi:RNA polymerase sigma-70 factor (ECF subfamily)